jgi:hypothetical protein
MGNRHADSCDIVPAEFGRERRENLLRRGALV